ncbi:hypothetical protein J437_LFUL018747 [Ladona fulva]|uniref:Uncharacterized protein n=1 Tax=Ladona fulva TaxID=123851 RepID=A0A8K0P7F9_LADFU|nr:hypothetical protein J437_LFUL018747 [Ladona fulva]
MRPSREPNERATPNLESGEEMRRRWPVSRSFLWRQSADVEPSFLSRLQYYLEPLTSDLVEIWNVPLPMPALIKASLSCFIFLVLLLPLLYLIFVAFVTVATLFWMFCPLFYGDCESLLTDFHKIVKLNLTSNEKNIVQAQFFLLLEDIFMFFTSFFSSLDFVILRAPGMLGL